MKTEVCVFNGKEISFLIERESEMMVNATEMAKIFGKDVFQFTRIDSTKNFIESCQKPQICGLLGIKSEDDLIVSRQKSGTWMHRILALKFAAWLNSDFEVWVYATIENLLFGRLVKREKSFERTMAIQKEMEYLLDKPDKTGEDFLRYLELQKELKYEVAFRRALTIEDLNGMKSLF
jgi:hypothetical protein